MQIPLPHTEAEGDGARVLSFPSPDDVLRLADRIRSGSAPEPGVRTPRPTISRYDNSKRRFVDLDLDTVVGILRRAEDGDTEDLADLWLRMLKTDAHLRSVWATRLAPVFSARWEVIPADVDESRAELALIGARGCEEALHGVDNIARSISALLDGIGVGFGVAEIVWGRGSILGKPGWIPVGLEPVHARRFGFADTFEIGLYDNGAAVPSLEADGWHVDKILSRGRMLARLPAGKYVVHQPVEIHDYPTATGLVHTLARWWWAKQVATKYWLSGAETFANPRFIGKVEQSAPGAQVVEDLLEGLEDLAADGVIVLRGGTSVETLDSKGEGAARTWESLVKFLDASISKAILGSTLNVEIGESGGNRAAAESQDDATIRPRQEQDAEQLWSSIRRDLFRHVIAYNPHIFPAGTPVPKGRSVLAEETVEVDDLIVASGAVRFDELRESRGLPALGGERGEAFVKPAAAAPPPTFAASDDTPAEVAPVPFAATAAKPWEVAASVARRLSLRAASATPSPSTTPSEPRRSE